MRRQRIYVDTSVFGGCFDAEFKAASVQLFDEFRAGKHVLLFPAITIRELATAPQAVRDLLGSVPEAYVEPVAETPEILELMNKYLTAGIVGKKSAGDAEHIAAASVARADIIVSWNFKHIVHFDKIRGYHAVNLMNGYPMVAIHSPPEVIERGD